MGRAERYSVSVLLLHPTHTHTCTNRETHNTLIHYLRNNSHHRGKTRRPSPSAVSILIFHNTPTPGCHLMYYQHVSMPIGHVPLCSLDHCTVRVFLIEPEMENGNSASTYCKASNVKKKKKQECLSTQHQYWKPPLVKAISLSGKHNNHIPSHDNLPHEQL